MREKRVAIVGGYGAVGRAAAHRLTAWRVARVRVGARQLERAEQLARELGPGCEAMHVDYEDALSLERFSSGCDVVVNCAGPSYRILDRIARVALECGAHYVDSYGDDPAHTLLVADLQRRADRCCVLSSGVMPGMAGLLPRWLARRGFDRARRLTAYVGGLERVTPAAASDYLLSLGSGYGQSLAAWRDGRSAPKALSPMWQAELPFFPRPVTAYPYLSTEAERVARALSLNDGSWYNVFDGTEGLTALNRLQASVAAGGDLAAAAAELARAAELDLFGRTRYQILLFELEGEAGGEALTQTLVVRSRDGFELSGTLTALTVAGVLAGEIPSGLHYAADILDPEVTMDRIRNSSAIESFDCFDGAAASYLEEGSL